MTESGKAAKAVTTDEGSSTEAVVAVDTEIVPIVVPPGHHALQSAWTFWYDKKSKKSSTSDNWEDNLVRLDTFCTVEGFWNLYSYMQRPSQQPNRSAFHMFRNKVPPMWESFPNGGCWILTVRKKCGLVDRLWEELVFSAIGELFETTDVVGVGISMRAKGDFLSVWTRDNKNQNVRNHIFERLKSLLTFAEDVGRTVEYKDNADSMKDRSTFRNAKPYELVSGNEDGGAAGANAEDD